MFLGGGAGGVFLEKSPPIIRALPMLWKHEVKHAVIVGEGGMGKTVSLLHWWEKLLDTGEPLNPLPLFIALNEFNQVNEGEGKNFIITNLLPYVIGSQDVESPDTQTPAL